MREIAHLGGEDRREERFLGEGERVCGSAYISDVLPIPTENLSVRSHQFREGGGRERDLSAKVAHSS
jgi:hypothetical protein